MRLHSRTFDGAIESLDPRGETQLPVANEEKGEPHEEVGEEGHQKGYLHGRVG